MNRLSGPQGLAQLCGNKAYLTLADPCIIIQFKYINQPEATVSQVYYLTFCVAQHVSGASTPIIRSLQLHCQPLVLPWSVVVAALLVVVWPTNNAATTTLQGKTRGCQCSCKLLMMDV